MYSDKKIVKIQSDLVRKRTHLVWCDINFLEVHAAVLFQVRDGSQGAYPDIHCMMEKEGQKERIRKRKRRKTLSA